MTEQEAERKKKRRRKKKATSNAIDQTINNVQENSDIEESVTKKIRLDSQEESTSQVCTKTNLSNSKEIINKTRVPEYSNLIFDMQQTVPNGTNMTVLSSLGANGVKTYTITEKDLIQLARAKDDEQCVNGLGIDKHVDSRPFITFSISDNSIVHLELVQDKENEQEDEIVKNLIGKEQIGDFKGIENSNRSNGRIESFIKNEVSENFKENYTEDSEVNGEIDNQTSFNENSKEYSQIGTPIQNGYAENFNEHEQIEDSFDLENDDSSQQFLSPTSLKHLPAKLKKYWFQRYLLFSLYDEGIMMDEEGWYSVTPEYLAEYLAKRCACDTIIDAMCGVGGNAIQFAKTCKKVIAIDIDETKLYCARNNASIYGVEDKIEFILGDFYDLIPKLKADVVFLSPPWGGLSYLESEVYDIKTMIPVDGERLFQESRKITKNIAYYVPRSINFYQMKKLCDSDEMCEFQQVIAWEKIKSYVVYYGDLVGNYYSEVIKIPKSLAIEYSESKGIKKRSRKRKRK